MTYTIAIDNETRLITRHRPAPLVVCTSAFDGDGDAQIWTRTEHRLDAVWRDWLEADEVELVGLNIAFDMATTAATYPNLLPLIFEKYRKNLVTDVGIRQQIWDIAVGRALANDGVATYSLAALVKMIFNETVEGKHGPDIWRLRYQELENVPLAKWPAAAVEYSQLDAYWPYRVWGAQNEAQDQIRYEHERAYTDFVLTLIQNYGMRTEAGAVAKCKAEHETKLLRIQPTLVKHGLVEIKQKGKDKGKAVKKQAAARERVIKGCLAQGIDPPLTPTGKKRKAADPAFTWRDEPKFVAIDKVACLTSQDPILLEKVRYGEAEKILSTYIPVLEQGIEGPITTRFGIAATGRTTSGTPSPPLVGTNWQNQPRTGGVRECFYPREGFVYLASDFSGAELHTLAQKCKDALGYSVLGDLLQKGKDPHLYLGSRLIGIDYNEALERYRNSDKQVKDYREDGKRANFGFAGGMRERTFILNQLKQREEFWEYDRAVKLRNAWLKAFPEMEEYFDYCKSELGPRGEAIIEIPGTGMLRAVRGLPMCANTYFQGPTAGGALRALCEVSRRCYTEPSSALFGSRPCNFIHDEILAEVPEESGHEAAMEMKEVMEHEYNFFTPDYPVEVEPTLMRCWSKKAKPVFDAEGRLVPWEG